MAAVNELPFGKYYGGVDTTPLFVMLAAEYARRTGDLAFIDSIWRALLAPPRGSRTTRDDTAASSATLAARPPGLNNQGWKDGHDSVFHADGSSPVGPIALVEVQGYAYAAFCGMADLARERGDEAGTARWNDAAVDLAARVESKFWRDDLQFYALALEGAWRPLPRARVGGTTGRGGVHLLAQGLRRPMADRWTSPAGGRAGTEVVVKARHGAFLMFPALPKHSVDANMSEEERIGVSFNLMFYSSTQQLSKPLW